MRNIIAVLTLLLSIFPAMSSAEPDSTTMSMSFEACIAKKAAVINQLGVNPRDIIPIVNTKIMTMTKLCTVDGSIIVTCSKPDNKMVVTQSKNKCN